MAKWEWEGMRIKVFLQIPISVLLNNFIIFQLLWSLHNRVLCVPETSAASEPVFSVVGRTYEGDTGKASHQPIISNSEQFAVSAQQFALIEL